MLVEIPLAHFQLGRLLLEDLFELLGAIAPITGAVRGVLELATGERERLGRQLHPRRIEVADLFVAGEHHVVRRLAHAGEGAVDLQAFAALERELVAEHR